MINLPHVFFWDPDITIEKEVILNIVVKQYVGNIFKCENYSVLLKYTFNSHLSLILDLSIHVSFRENYDMNYFW